jgi:hypothetical protein
MFVFIFECLFIPFLFICLFDCYFVLFVFVLILPLCAWAFLANYLILLSNSSGRHPKLLPQGTFNQKNYFFNVRD